MYILRDVVRKYLDSKQKLRILDVGSKDFERPEKKLNFGRYLNNPPLWEYTGLDLEPGRNVDVVSNDPYNYPFPDDSFDVVVSGCALEHVLDMHKFVKELARVSKGLVIIIAPNTHPEHKFPVDCWRIFPDGMTFLLKDIAGLQIVESRIAGARKMHDTLGIGLKIK